MKITAIILACYLFVGSLIPNMDFSQLLHIPDHLEHFQIHQHEAEQLGDSFNLLDFLQLFTSSDHSLEHDHSNDHSNLPCHTLHTSVLFFTIPVHNIVLHLTTVNATKEVVYQNNLYLTGFIPSLIQPPSLG